MASPVVYCPRCDRSFSMKGTRDENMRQMENHVRRAHPDYVLEVKK